MASLKVAVSHPNLAKGAGLSVTHLGLVKNGGSITVDTTAQATFKKRTGKTVTEFFKGNAIVTVTEEKGGEN